MRRERRAALPKSSDTMRRIEKREEENRLIREYFKMECELCTFTMKTFKEALSHYRTKHKRSGYLMCCGKKIPNRTVALDHITMHKNPDAFK